MIGSEGVPGDFFQSVYDGTPPWEIGRAQGEFVRLADAGAIFGEVLDVGCGTGELAIFLAQRGLRVCGVDAVPVAIERARAKASERGAAVEFLVGDALKLDALGRQFDTVLDCGLFHTFSDADRPRYVAGLHAVTRPGGVLHLLCFSELQGGDEGPRRVTQAELRAAFAAGWHVRGVNPARFESLLAFGAAAAWLMKAERA